MSLRERQLLLQIPIKKKLVYVLFTDGTAAGVATKGRGFKAM